MQNEFLQQSTYLSTNYITCLLENGDIYKVNGMYGTKEKVGITTEKETEITNILDEYYNKMVEAGLIVKEKTAEEIQAEQNLLIKQLLEKVNSLEDKIGGNINGNPRQNNANGENDGSKRPIKSDKQHKPSDENGTTKS